MKNWGVLLGCVFILLCLSFRPALPCSAFHLADGEGHFVGKNYDWGLGNGLVIVNPRGLAKEAHDNGSDTPGNPARWTSKFGSVTFNQYGRELPMGGVNEAGLAVEVLLLGETRYPDPDARPYVSMLQWVQYQLDTAATVGEVLAGDGDLRIFSDRTSPGMHYFVCDRNGNAAVIEFLDGKMVAYAGENLPVRALANSTYANSLEIWNRHGTSGVDRFTTAGLMIAENAPEAPRNPVDRSFGILKRVAQGLFTQWSIVYDLKNLRVYFTTPPSQSVRRIDLAPLDFSCDMPAKVLDIQKQFEGDAAGSFVDYSRRINHSMIEESFRNTSFLSGRPAEQLNRLADYPDGFACAGEKGLK